MSVDVYRIHTAVGNGQSGSGDVRLFTDKDEFVREVTLAMIEAYANKSVPHSPRDKWTEWRAVRAWLDKVIRRGVEPKGWTTQRVIKVEKLIEGDWVELSPSLIMPGIRFGIQP